MSIEKIDFERPEDCTTCWELQRDYGIDKQKTARYIRMGKLNGFMVKSQDEKWKLVKWYIKRDEVLERYIEKNKRA